MCAQPAAGVQPGLTDEHSWVMPFRQTHIRKSCGPNPSEVCSVGLGDGLGCHFAKSYFESLGVTITGKDAKCNYSLDGLYVEFADGMEVSAGKVTA